MNFSLLLQKAALSALAMAIAGCTSTHVASSGTVDSLDLYLARASLLQVDFEQYKLNGSRLYSECGQIRNGRHITLDQQFATIEPAQKDLLAQQVFNLSQRHTGRKRSLPPPGDARGFADPGQIFLQMQVNGEKTELRTSVDDISDPKTIEAGAVKALAVQIRALTASAPATGRTCGYGSFYGIPSR